jgi:DNA-binding transcriptional LysR family regulator
MRMTSAVALADLADARWIEAPDIAPPLAAVQRAAQTQGFRAALRYDGTDALALIRLAAAGHGLTLLPGTVTAAPVPGCAFAAIAVSPPRLVHRVELVHGNLPAGSPAAALTALLS